MFFLFTCRKWLICVVGWLLIGILIISYWRHLKTIWTLFNDDNSTSNVERRVWSERWKLCSIGVWTCTDRGVLEEK